MVEQVGNITREDVLERMREIEKEHRIRILYACEAGSRAYGLNHAKSDYDVRFLFVRDEKAYLTVRTHLPKHDVIAPRVVGDWDLSGWDLKKALLMLRDCNPTLIEWLFSPVVYLEVGDAVKSMRKIAQQYFNTVVCMHHYFNWMRPTYKKLLLGREKGEELPLKNVLCVLRLLFSLRWLEKPDAGVVPLHFAQLAAAVLEDVDVDVLENVNMLADSRRVYGCSVMPQSETVGNIFGFMSEEARRFEKRKFAGKHMEKASYETVDAIFRSALMGE